jgi:hypothetical protein
MKKVFFMGFFLIFHGFYPMEVNQFRVVHIGVELTPGRWSTLSEGQHRRRATWPISATDSDRNLKW